MSEQSTCEGEVINLTDIRTELDADILFMSCGKWKLFMTHGKVGHDAAMMYMHLMWTARMQQTNKVKATNTYLMRGLSMSKERVMAAKRLIADLCMIEAIPRRDAKGQIAGWYLQINISAVHPAETLPTKPAQEPKAKELPHPDARACREMFSQLIAITNWAKEGSAIKDMLKRYGLCEIQSKLAQFMSNKQAGKKFYVDAPPLPSVIRAAWDSISCDEADQDLIEFKRQRGYL